MTTSNPLSFVPGPRATEAQVAPVPTPPQNAPEDMVVVPRHVADAAYHVLKAAQALRDKAGNDIFGILGRALSHGRAEFEIKYDPPCDACHVEVGQGFPHLDDCWSEEAVRYRAVPVPPPIID